MAHGFHDALEANGHEVVSYRLYNRFAFAERGLPDGLKEDITLISRIASESMVVEALSHEVDAVLIASAVATHPNGPVLCRRAGFPVVVLHTESPYEDEEQAYFSQFCDLSFTHERVSARRLGWHYLPHAFDPARHRRVEPEQECDVLIVGTGWPERVALLAGVDWTGIDLRILGMWPEIGEDHPLRRYYTQAVIDNDALPGLYAGAKVCLNFHREHPRAESLNPRAYEVAACGAFQLSDPRAELVEVFGDCVPTFRNAPELQALLAVYLPDPGARESMASCAQRAVQQHTFSHRAAEMAEVIEAKLAERRAPALTL